MGVCQALLRKPIEDSVSASGTRLQVRLAPIAAFRAPLPVRIAEVAFQRRRPKRSPILAGNYCKWCAKRFGVKTGDFGRYFGAFVSRWGEDGTDLMREA